jgi:hypothetical protein
MKRLIALWAVIAIWTAVGCVADVETGEDGAGGALMSEAHADNVGETAQALGYNCEAACEAAGVVTRNFCNNIPSRYVDDCHIESRDAVNACANEPAAPGCQDACTQGWYTFNRDFCNELPKKEGALRARCWAASNKGRAACIAKGSMGYRR